MIKYIAPVLLSLLFLSVNAFAQDFELVQVYYNADSFRLNAQQKVILDSVVENYSNRRILIDGHADYNGLESRNEAIAGKRANVVLRYLVDRGFPETQVIHVVGVGQAAGSINAGNKQKDGAADRRVDIFIVKGAAVKSKLKVAPPPVIKNTVTIEPLKNVTDIDYKKLKVGDLITLKNISFIPGTDTLMPESYDELNNLYDILSHHTTLKISLEGHVCCTLYPDGYVQDTPNWDLSVKRAMMVRTLLTLKGINPSRLSYVGFGHTRPIYQQELQPWQAQANRRVEIRIMEK